ncbi:hypothetical protein RB195_018078 [Necator americanus]|uniref:Uncharacterized protein n=1 Tax=Necator americanus TaxID=51031 RepID=A0ABR1C9Q0_NECAM
MGKNGESATKPEKKSTAAEPPTSGLRKIYTNAKRIRKEEEAMLTLCKNCMQTIRTKKAAADKLREEAEAEMVASAGRLDEHIRRVTRVLDGITRMHITDATEAAERLGKLLDIDVDAEEKMDNLRKRVAYLEYQRRSQESIFYRIFCYIYSCLQWIAVQLIEFYQTRRALMEAMTHSTLPPVSPPLKQSDEEDVTLKHLRTGAA